MEDRAEVQAHQVLPVVGFGVGEVRQVEARRGIAGVVDEDVDRSGGLAHGADLDRAGDVGLHRRRDRLAAEVGRDLGRAFLVDVVHVDERTAADEHARDLGADAVAATGDERAATREIDLQRHYPALALAPGRRPARAAQGTCAARSSAHQTSMTTGMTAGRRRVRSSMNRPSDLRAWRRMVSKSVAPSSAASAIDASTTCLRLLEQVLGLGRVDPTAGDDLGTGHDLAGLRVDGDDHDDDALLGQVAPVAEHAVADVADDAVDVHVARRAPPGARPRAPSRARSVTTSPSSQTSTWSSAHTGIDSARRAWCTRCRYSPCTGTNHSGCSEVEERTSAPPATRGPTRAPASCGRAPPRRRRGAASRSRATRSTRCRGSRAREITTTSSSQIFTYLCSCAAISDSALIGSPCEPVQMMHTSPGA